MLPATLPQLREPCFCVAGRTCAVCRAWAQGTPQPTRAQVLGGIQSKLKALRSRLPQEEARLAAMKRFRLETQAAWQRRKKRGYEAVKRLKHSIANLEARLAAWAEGEP